MAKKYIDADRLKAIMQPEYNRNKALFNKTKERYVEGIVYGLDIAEQSIDCLQQEQESVAEQFAKVVRENLSEIGNNAQFQFEQLYFEITGTKMYGGYND